MTKIIRTAAILAMAAFLAGCVSSLAEVGRQPQLTPVGAGLSSEHAVLPDVEFPAEDATSAYAARNRAYDSLFRDSRAMAIGDVVTVAISIDDKASLDSTSNRSRTSSTGLGFNLGYDLPPRTYEGNAKGDIAADSTAKGKGSIARSETIDLSVAAVVMQVLPNGNLLISGSQEVRVNNEVRVLTIAGIVNPKDIRSDNTVSYDKIAEARVSYAGRGRISEVQQPAWGQQLYDKLTPW